MIDPGLKGKTVLITGANNPRGIGAATARAFASVGAHVVLHYKKTELQDQRPMPAEVPYAELQTNDASDIVGELRDLGVEAAAIEIDFLEDPRTQPLFRFAEKSVGPVSVLVNNAAYSDSDTLVPRKAGDESEARRSILGFDLTELDTASLDAHLAVNVRTPALLMTEFARRIRQRGERWGRIINISTDAAECFPSEVSYGASKLALESLTRSAAREFGPFGITANIVSPGPIQTGWMPDDLVDGAVSSIPLGRIGQPEDVADVIVFLASQQARWVTGQRIHVGGGHRMT